MRKLSFVLAAATVLGAIAASFLLSPTPVQAQQKKLWHGWVEELQRIGAPPPPPAVPAKAAPARAPAKMKGDKK